MKKTYRPTKAIVDLSSIRKNLQAFQERVGEAGIIAVVKADAYGHGVAEVSREALESGATMLAVATPDEALFLREEGFDSEILVMGATPPNFIPVAQELNIIVTAISLEWLLLAADSWEENLPKLKVHLKIDTGMRRVGIQLGEVKKALAVLGKENFELHGIYTHFATADEEVNHLFLEQIEKIRSIRELIDDPSIMFHVSNSAAAIMHPDLAFDAARIGISMYGIAPSSYVKKEMPFDLKPALELETEIVHVKKVAQGTTLSYGATYRCEQDEWIATLPIGYADGLLRGLQGQEVLVKGRRVPIVGRICMDQCMIRLPEQMPIGEKVQLIGKQGAEEILVDEWAEKLDTIPYEIPCILTKRVPRIYRELRESRNYLFNSQIEC